MKTATKAATTGKHYIEYRRGEEPEVYLSSRHTSSSNTYWWPVRGDYTQALEDFVNSLGTQVENVEGGLAWKDGSVKIADDTITVVTKSNIKTQLINFYVATAKRPLAVDGLELILG